MGRAEGLPGGGEGPVWGGRPQGRGDRGGQHLRAAWQFLGYWGRPVLSGLTAAEGRFRSPLVALLLRNYPSPLTQRVIAGQ